jgi:hypothetical protein
VSNVIPLATTLNLFISFLDKYYFLCGVFNNKGG